MVERVRVPVEGRDCGDVPPLPLRRRLDGKGLLDRQPARLQRLPGRRGNERIVPPGHGDAPVTHRARGVELRDGGERRARGLEPEGVQERHGSVELLLRRRAAGDGEVHLTDLAGGLNVRVAVLLRDERWDAERRREKHDNR